ncbi:MAG: hypothetical protein JJU00_20165 [Opitutales bacterium]|nr:hypothetical protein [Opitutales bacterium]
MPKTILQLKRIAVPAAILILMGAILLAPPNPFKALFLHAADLPLTLASRMLLEIIPGNPAVTAFVAWIMFLFFKRPGPQSLEMAATAIFSGMLLVFVIKFSEFLGTLQVTVGDNAGFDLSLIMEGYHAMAIGFCGICVLAIVVLRKVVLEPVAEESRRVVPVVTRAKKPLWLPALACAAAALVLVWVYLTWMPVEQPVASGAEHTEMRSEEGLETKDKAHDVEVTASTERVERLDLARDHSHVGGPEDLPGGLPAGLRFTWDGGAGQGWEPAFVLRDEGGFRRDGRFVQRGDAELEAYAIEWGPAVRTDDGHHLHFHKAVLYRLTEFFAHNTGRGDHVVHVSVARGKIHLRVTDEDGTMRIIEVSRS